MFDAAECHNVITHPAALDDLGLAPPKITRIAASLAFSGTFLPAQRCTTLGDGHVALAVITGARYGRIGDQQVWRCRTKTVGEAAAGQGH